MKKTVLVATIIGIILLFTQCKKGEDTTEITKGIKIGEVKLSNTELNLIPYNLSDSSIFKDSLGNVDTFNVVARKINISRTYKEGSYGVITDYYDIENLFIRLSNNNNYDINLDLRPPLPPYCSSQNINKNPFYISFYPPNNSTTQISSNYFINYIDTSNFYYSSEGLSIPYYNTLTIINKTFNSVYELKHSQSFLPDNSIETVYYNKTKGIVGFTTKNGIRWYFDN